jgi:hypothetical protein
MVDRTQAPPVSVAHPHWLGARMWLFRVCAVVGLLFAVFGNVAVWADRTVFNTDTFVSTVSPVLDQPAVQDAASQRLAGELTERAELDSRISEQLPPGLTFLGPPLTASARQLIADAVLRAMESGRVHALRNATLTALHERLVRLLQNRSTAIERENGTVYLDLRPALVEAASDLGLEGRQQLLDNVNIPPDAGRIEIGKSRSEYTWLGFVARNHRAVGVALIALPIALFAAAILLGRNRRRATFLCGILVAVAGIMSLVILLPLRAVLVSQAGNADVARSSFRILMEGYRLQSLVVIVIGAAVAVAALFVRRNAEQRRSVLNSAVTTHGAALRLVAFAAAAVLLVTWPTPDWRFYVALFGSLAVALFAIQLFASEADWSRNLRSRVSTMMEGIRKPPAADANRGGWTQEHLTGLRVAGVAVFIAFALLWPGLTWSGIILLLLAGFVYLGAVDWLAREL